MEQDIRAEALFLEAESLCRAARRPGAGLISDASEVHVSPSGQFAVFTGTLVDKLEGSLPTRICRIDLESGAVGILTFGPNTDRMPKLSPDGATIAFLSDRGKPGDFQLYLFDIATSSVRRTPAVEGWVEYLHWSADGRRILLGVAGHGADLSGGGGGGATKAVAAELPAWTPTVERGNEHSRWRRLWVYDVSGDCIKRFGPDTLNVWEAAWCGTAAVAAIASLNPMEGSWYSAHLFLIDLASEHAQEVFVPEHQLGWPAASPTGRWLAFVEAVCSDRGIVAGELRILDRQSGNVQAVPTAGTDITCLEWRSEDVLLMAGHRGFETVVSRYSCAARALTQCWSSSEVTASGRYIAVSPIGATGDCVLIAEDFLRAPEIAVIRDGEYRTVKSFDLDHGDQAKVIGAVEKVVWNAPDGLEIQGWLLLPQGAGPHPLVMDIHGGPAWHWRQRWLGRATVHTLMLLRRGCAVFYPNPRGSAGRGTDYARRVVGDMGGKDTHDYLAGVDHLIARGVADSTRLGLTGISYGGFMSSWLVGQDSRFSAAVSVSPVTNHVTQHLISNLPQFVSLYLADTYTNTSGKYYERSPILYAHNVRTPTLNICGALDRCTPPAEAVQFHNALLENGVVSELVIYPQEGHGIRKFPAIIDYSARLVGWFETYLLGKDIPAPRRL